MKLTIGQKILFGYGLAMLVMAVTGIAAYRSTQHLIEANDWVRHTLVVIGDAEDIRSTLIELESASRAFVVTGDERFLESIDALRSRLPESRKLLRTLTADNPAQQRRIDGVDPVIDRVLADLTNTSNTRREKGFPAALALMQQTSGRERMAEIRVLLSVIENDERALLNDRGLVAQSEAQNANRIILYGNLFTFALAAFLGIATHLSIVRPLRVFQQFVNSVGEGDLTREPVREGGDELGELAHGLNRMVTS